MKTRMKTIQMPHEPGTRWRTLATLLLLGTGAAHAQMVSQHPLSVGAGVPGNMVLTPSVEYPTINSKANLGNFAATTEYTGYFDAFKCYKYQYNATESLRHFYPFRTTGTTPAVCSAAAQEWSGNWLNWATTQTIDPFRKALTGGYRVRDTATETWLEKARHDGQGGIGYFPIATVLGSGTIAGAIPSPNWATVRSRVVGAGSELFFSSSPTAAALTAVALATTVAYDPATHSLNNIGTNPTTYWRVSVRVKVCDSAIGLEPNCVRYATAYKPDGLIQKYSNKIRFSVFGYLLDNGAFRDGGVLRANQKFVGPTFLNRATAAWETNPNREWDDNGVFIDNPNPADAAATEALVNGGVVTHPIRYSGVINYLNRFAQLTNTNAKNYDPVSELYYTATRYLRRLAPVSTYSNLGLRYTSAAGVATAAGADRFNLTDGFPVITNWEDPYEYSCQSTGILGIGDVYTHKDKNLKGNTASTTNEPAMPGAVSGDPMMSLSGDPSAGTVVEWTQRAYALEGVAYNAVLNAGLNNSPYMVGLAYYTNTQDLRTDLASDQTASTHWVDVRELQKIEPRIRNQYWMAAKYGGFSVPDDYDALTNVTALPATWWTTAGDTLTSNSTDWANETFNRAGNYYVADRPATMVQSLTRAFAKISATRSGSGSSLAANSTRLDTQTRAYQASFRSGSWLGQLASFSFDPVTDTMSSTPEWTAGSKMPAWNARNVYFHNPSGTPAGTYAQFTWANLAAAQQTALNSLNATLAPATGSDVVNYILGNQLLEESAPGGSLRTRVAQPGWSPYLGDIVNSTPVYVGAPNANLYRNSPGVWDGKSTHAAFAAARASRLPVVWAGANDGMLHAFNATSGNVASGREVYAFIPNTAILGGLVTVADPDYEHRYFIDGDMAIADVYDTGASAWKTILVATMGRGGPGVFALDITDPTSVQFLWERNATDIPELGHNIGRPVIAQIANGDWRVLFGNGPDSGAGTANLIVIEALDGDTTVFGTDSSTSSGLSAVLARDTNADGLADTAYAGDLQGNLWKFADLTGSGAATLLFVATDGTTRQPITAAPLVGRDPDTNATWVFFGTGRYLNEADLLTTQLQTWYGFKDTGTLVARSELLQRTTVFVETKFDYDLRTVTEAVAGDLAGYRGWFIDLPDTAERMVLPNVFDGNSIMGTTRSPEGGDACAPSGSGWIMAINPFTGARLDNTKFDLNKDGIFDNRDKRTSPVEIISGIRRNPQPDDPFDGPSPPNQGRRIGNLWCYTMDNGQTECIPMQGSDAEARRGSWREITN